MPITEELKNIKKLESVDFTHEQAETMTEIIEDAQLAGYENLKDFISNENEKLRNEIKLVKAELKTDIAETSKDLLFKISAFVTAVVGLAVAIIKLF